MLMKLLIRILGMSAMLMPYAMAQETRFFSLFINNSTSKSFFISYDYISPNQRSQFDSTKLFDPCIELGASGGAHSMQVLSGEHKWMCGGTTNNHYDGYYNYHVRAVDPAHFDIRDIFSYWDTWDVNANDDPARIRIHDENGNTKFDWVAKDNKDYKSIYTIYILNDDGSYSETMIKREDGDNRDMWNIWSNPVDLLRNTCWSDSKGCSTIIHQANS